MLSIAFGGRPGCGRANRSCPQKLVAVCARMYPVGNETKLRVTWGGTRDVACVRVCRLQDPPPLHPCTLRARRMGEGKTGEGDGEHLRWPQEAREGLRRTTM